MRLRSLSIASLFLSTLLLFTACDEADAPQRLSVRLFNEADLGLPNASSTDTLRFSVLDRQTGAVIQRDTISVSGEHGVGDFKSIPYGEELQLFVEALDGSGNPIASGGSSHFDVIEAEASTESFFIFLVNVNEFSPASGIFQGPPGGPALQVNPSPFEGSPAQPRAGHRAVNLSDGRALIIGGASLTAQGSGVGQSNISATWDSLIIYDPRNGYFDLQRDASGGLITLGTSRAYHTVTELSEDQFLVTGGVHTPLSDNLEVLDSAELIRRNPDGSFTVTELSPMSSPRMRHTASLRSDGTVLIAGGATLDSGNPVALNSAELFNDGSFTAIGTMNTARYNHTATNLSDPDLVVLCGGIRAEDDVVADCDLLSKSDGQPVFVEIPPMQTARQDHAAVLLSPKNGRFVMLAGGFTTDDTTTPTASYEILDTEEGRFRPDLVSETLKKARGAFDIVKLSRNDDLMLIGGIGISSTGEGTASIPDVEVLSTITPGEIDYVPQLLPSTMSNDRFDHDSLLLSNGMVLITGGGRLENGVTTSLLFSDVFNPGPPDIIRQR